MNFLLVVHALSALFTVTFAVYTAFHIFHRTSMEHRVNLVTRRIAPLVVSRTPKNKIIETLKKEGHAEHEVSELYDKVSLSFGKNSAQNKTK